MGKSIRIYLADNQPSDIRLAEILNWTGQGIAFPRSKTGFIKTWEEANRQGVYFLFGQNENGADLVYIGETEKVAIRIAQHVKEKEFWKECIAFTSKDENLTKAHVKYLESKFINEATQSGRYLVENASESQQSALPRGDKDAMDEFADNVKILLGVLGHRVLEPIIITINSQQYASVTQEQAQQSPHNDEFLEHKFTINSGFATLIRKSDELVVLKGSNAKLEEQESLKTGYKAIREKLKITGILKNVGGKYEFTQNYVFDSPSAAACVIVGYTINGRTAWVDSNNKTFKEIEERELEQSTPITPIESSHTYEDIPIQSPSVDA